MKTLTALSDADIRAVAPSVFAEHPSDRMSDRYKFISTADAVGRMREIGWLPVSAQQTRSWKGNKRDFAKHMLRFRQESDFQYFEPGRHEFYQRGNEPIIVEAWLRNSHDGTSRLEMGAGPFSVLCYNGAMVACGEWNSYKFKHQGEIMDEVLDATGKIIAGIPRIAEMIYDWRKINLDFEQQRAFADRTLAMRYGTNRDVWPIAGPALLDSRREVDNDPSLWTVFNRVQENLLSGGITSGIKKEGGKRVSTTRPVRAVDEVSRLNEGLWALAEEFAEECAA